MRLPWGLPIVVLLLLIVAGIGGYRIEIERTLSRMLPRNFVRQIPYNRKSSKLQGRMRHETFVDLVSPTGYAVEEHDITTDDGYILALHRMPGGPKSPVAPNKPAVLLLHGLLAASDVWVLRGPKEDFTFMLVDAGYDVWVMNYRGNFYGKRHKKLIPKEDKFWRFSWHEMGVYDTATAIDHVLNTTGQSKVALVGHSMGTTTGLVLLSSKPEYNDKVNVFLGFAPIAIFTHLLPGPISVISKRYGRQLQKSLKTIGITEVFPRNPSAYGLYSAVCEMPHIELLCQRVLWTLTGLTRNSQFDAIDFNKMPRVLAHYPQGSSLDTIMHYQQIMLSGKFRPYDFGPDGNWIRYKDVNPPEYPLEKIKVPVILYYGLNDGYTTREDVNALAARLPRVEIHPISHERFSHLDFILSNYSKQALYDDAKHDLDRFRADRVDAPNEEPPNLRLAIEQAKLAPTTITV
ncbi:hypothetical protein QAD02_012188 [Eretmocerus hayati]|uniref:Uncharacterized protein n=1 Tax=Eretmocerus hayati TaxID=131215 RepID=A0ACC2NZ06_9HYME|nr:hypothetical protein QAD02_012188 [Eretmocerus hayati]